MKIFVLGLIIFLAGLATATGEISAFVSTVAQNEQVCDGLDSGKIDVNDPQSVTVTAPDGFLIDRYCVKAGSANQGDGPVYVDVNPPQKTVTITHPSGKEISHYSVSYVPITETTTTDTTTTDTTTTTTTGTTDTTTTSTTTTGTTETSTTSTTPTTPAPTTPAATTPTPEATTPSKPVQAPSAAPEKPKKKVSKPSAPVFKPPVDTETLPFTP